MTKAVGCCSGPGGHRGISWLLPVAIEACKSCEVISSICASVATSILGKKLKFAVTGMPGVGKTALFDQVWDRAYKRGYKLERCINFFRLNHQKAHCS